MTEQKSKAELLEMRRALYTHFDALIAGLSEQQIQMLEVNGSSVRHAEQEDKATIRGELVIYPPHTPLRIPRVNKSPLWIRQGTTWTKR